MVTAAVSTSPAEAQPLRDEVSALPKSLRQELRSEVAALQPDQAAHMLSVLFPDREGRIASHAFALASLTGYRLGTYSVPNVVNLFWHVQQTCRDKSPEILLRHTLLEDLLVQSTRGRDRLAILEFRYSRQAKAKINEALGRGKNMIKTLATQIELPDAGTVLADIRTASYQREEAFHALKAIAAETLPHILDEHYDVNGNPTGRTRREQADYLESEVDDLDRERKRLSRQLLNRDRRDDDGWLRWLLEIDERLENCQDYRREKQLRENLRECRHELGLDHVDDWPGAVEQARDIVGLLDQLVNLRAQLSAINATLQQAESRLRGALQLIDEIVFTDRQIDEMVPELDREDRTTGFAPSEEYLDGQTRLMLEKFLIDDAEDAAEGDADALLAAAANL